MQDANDAPAGGNDWNTPAATPAPAAMPADDDNGGMPAMPADMPAGGNGDDGAAGGNDWNTPAAAPADDQAAV